MVRTDMIDTPEIEKDNTELLTRDQMVERIYTILSEPPLNIGKHDYCYIKIVGNHVEIGRAKIVIEE